MEKTIKRPGIWKTLLAALTCTLAGLMPPLLCVAGGFLGYVLLSGGAVPFLSAALLSLGGAYLLFGQGGLLLCALGVLSGLLLALLLHKKAGYFDSALLCAALHTAALYLMISLPDIRGGATAFHTATQALSAAVSETVGELASMPGMTQQQLELFEQAGRELAALTPVYMPAVLCALGAFLGLFNLLFCARLSRRAGVELRPMRRFALWRLPREFMNGILVMVVGMIAALALNIAAMDAVYAAVSTIAFIPFAVQGASFFWFLFQLQRNPFTGVVLLMLMVFLLPVSVTLLAAVGALEQIFHLRRRILARGRGDGQ